MIGGLATMAFVPVANLLARLIARYPKAVRRQGGGG